MGLGPDGHTASLFPQSRALDEKKRWVLAVAKAGMEPFVPRVTLTFPALASTREMLFLVDGAGKRDILHRVFSGEDLPGSARLFRRRTGLAARPRRGAGGRVVKADASDIPSVIVVMGVSGSGKSTVASMLAHRLHWTYEDGDWFHPEVERREDASRRAADR